MSNPITEQILGAWDDVVEEDERAPAEESSETTEPVATTLEEEPGQDEVVSDDEVEEAPVEEEEEEAPEEPGEEVEEEEAPEEEEPEAPPGEEAEPPADSISDDPEVQAYLARYNGDVEAALKAAANQRRLFGRQGQELGQLRARVTELEEEREQAQLFAQAGALMTVEQQQWVEEAVGSEQPIQYIQAAVNEKEYDLARAVLEQGEFSTVQALRLAQAIDSAEGRSMQEALPEEVSGGWNHQELFDVLQSFYPDMPSFEAEMVSTLEAMGNDHPLAMKARSQDPEEAGQALIAIYEIARAKTATVASTREAVKTRRRQAGDDARSAAVVSSSQATPPQTQTPRTKQLMPGLTLEALEAEFDAQQ